MAQPGAIMDMLNNVTKTVKEGIKRGLTEGEQKKENSKKARKLATSDSRVQPDSTAQEYDRLGQCGYLTFTRE